MQVSQAGGASLRSETEVAAELVPRIRSGDETAETEFVERYSRGLLYLLQRLTGDLALAKDLRQESLLIVLTRLRDKGLDEPEKLSAFLRGTAKNLYIAEYRKRIRRKTDDGVERWDQIAADPGSNPLRELQRNEEAALVRRMIEKLKDRDREILNRFYIAEETKEDICVDLGLSHLQFNQVIFRARRRLKEELDRFRSKRN